MVYLPCDKGQVVDMQIHHHPYAPWCWYIYGHNWVIYVGQMLVNMSNMEHMGIYNYSWKLYIYIFMVYMVFIYGRWKIMETTNLYSFKYLQELWLMGMATIPPTKMAIWGMVYDIGNTITN